MNHSERLNGEAQRLAEHQRAVAAAIRAMREQERRQRAIEVRFFWGVVITILAVVGSFFL